MEEQYAEVMKLEPTNWMPVRTSLNGAILFDKPNSKVPVMRELLGHAKTINERDTMEFFGNLEFGNDLLPMMEHKVLIKIDPAATGLREMLKKYPPLRSTIVYEHLSVGDILFLVDNIPTLLIERKTIMEFKDSMIDGRFRMQRLRMMELRENQPQLKLAFLFEGSFDYMHNNPSYMQTLKRVASQLESEYGIYRLESSNLKDTIRQIFRDADAFRQKGSSVFPQLLTKQIHTMKKYGRKLIEKATVDEQQHEQNPKHFKEQHQREEEERRTAVIMTATYPRIYTSTEAEYFNSIKEEGRRLLWERRSREKKYRLRNDIDRHGVERRANIIIHAIPTDTCTICQQYPNMIYDTCMHQCICSDCEVYRSCCPVCGGNAHNIMVTKEEVERFAKDRADVTRERIAEEERRLVKQIRDDQQQIMRIIEKEKRREQHRRWLRSRLEEEQRRAKVAEMELMMTALVRHLKIQRSGFVPTDDCTICLDSYPNVIFEKCKHQCVCINCNNHIKKCPLCRETETNKFITVSKQEINLRETQRALVVRSDKIARWALVKQIITEFHIEEAKECAICFDPDCNLTILRPCNHWAVCFKCTNNLKWCPLCEQPIAEVLSTD